MKPYFFVWQRRIYPSKRERWIVVFAPADNVDLLPLDLSEFLQKVPLCERILIISLAFNRQVFSSAKFVDRFQDRLPFDIKLQGDFVTFWFADEMGKLSDMEGSVIADEVVHDLISCGAACALEQTHSDGAHRAIVELPSGFHVVAPSGAHSSHLVRIGEILTESATIDFFAFALLRFLTPKMTAIAFDSGSLAVVGYALQNLLLRFAQRGSKKVRELYQFGFGSWDGFRQIGDGEKPTKLSADEATLYLISVSTGGSMAREMCRRGFPKANIVTLFHYTEQPLYGEAICCVLKDERFAKQFPKLQIYADDCPLCKAGSRALRLRGDRFVPIAAQSLPFDLLVRSVSPELRAFMERAIGTRSIKAHHGTGMFSHVHDLFVDFARLCRGEKYGARLKRAINQSVPFAADRIYFCDDPGARCLAETIVKEMESKGLARPQLIDSVELESLNTDLHRTQASSLVVAGCVASGRSLMRISRLLRNVEKEGSITYFVGLRRCSSKEAQAHMESTLRFASDNRIRFAFQSVDDVFVGDNTPFRSSIWSRELDLLVQIADNEPEATRIVEQRIDELRSMSGGAGSGLIDNLFWPTGDKPLELRGNFSFFSTELARQATQADLFFFISTLLHQQRMKFAQGGQHRPILKPENFHRFNDGIIRACLLRACYPTELDYAHDQVYDQHVGYFLRDALTHSETAEGEARTEFLIAIALSHLRVSRQCLEWAIDNSSSHIQKGTIDFYLIEHIRSTILA